jgi:hypothetical protein
MRPWTTPNSELRTSVKATTVKATTGRPLRSKDSLTALFLFMSVPMFGQVSTGTITGIVTDPSGGAVPNVVVSVVQAETNVESRATTNMEGIYRVQSLQPGAAK